MKPKILPLIFLAALAAVPSGAQVTPAAPAGAVAAPAGYLIAAGDVLGVNVINFPNASTPQAMVAPDGTITLPLINEVSVVGLTREQATRLLTRKLQKYYRSPSVTVSLIQKHPETVVLSGFLNHTGAIDYKPGLHLMDALAQMGGVSPNADATRAVLTHADGTKVTLDLSHPETKGGTDVDIALQPGDVLLVPQQQGKINVTGDGIKQPGSVTYREDLTLLEALTACGGAIPETADLSASKLTRNGVDQKIDFNDLLHGSDTKSDVLLHPGDSINIPEKKNRTYVFGEVQRQGYYYYKDGDRVTDALNSAGLVPDADTGKINILHVSKDKTAVRMEVINLNNFLLRGQAGGNPEVHPGDHLYIPRQHHSVTFNDILAPLTGVGAAASGVRILQGH